MSHPNFLYSLFAAATMISPLAAAEWSWEWKPSADEKGITASVCPMKYGKKWAYTVEIDDDPKGTGLLAPDLFSRLRFTDAPPGLPGGKENPAVGTMAVFIYWIGANESMLSYADLRSLQAKGWGVANHGYMHIGRTFGTPPEILTPEQTKQELFWSQAVLAEALGHGRAFTHFVYPNGYEPYAPYLKDFGLVSGSLVGGKGGVHLASDSMDFQFISRDYLDEFVWSGSTAQGDPAWALPKDGPKPGDILIDFTHQIDVSPDSANQKRWVERLKILQGRYGTGGTDEFWSAPTDEIVNYSRAAHAAQVALSPGKLALTIPDDLPGSALTVKLEGVPTGTVIPPPPGGAVYRSDGTVWLTSPMIGQPGSPVAGPAIRPIYRGPARESILLDHPEKIAGVQVRQDGKPIDLSVTLVQPDGTTLLLGERKEKSPRVSGTHLFAALPNGEAPLVREIRLPADEGLQEVVVWAVAEEPPGAAR